MTGASGNGSATYAEIKRQPRIWKTILESLDSDCQQYDRLVDSYRDSNWVFTGCGSSYYLAQTASYCFGARTSIPCKAVPASEILIFPEVVFSPGTKNVLVAFSRSGSTTETVRAVEKAKAAFNVPSVSVSCDFDSEISSRSDHAVRFPFEKEESVVMTSSFTSMLLSILFLAGTRAKDSDFWKKLLTLPEASERIISKYEGLVAQIGELDDVDTWVFLGQGPFYGVANEGALKIQEMTLSTSQGYHSLEYRHGPMSTAGPRTLIVVLCSQAGGPIERDLILDLKKLGARLLVFADEATTAALSDVDYKVALPGEYGDLLSPLLCLPLLQLLGYYRARRMGLNPDRPRNLTAVVKLDL
ncbi:MAG: SIS domain-containing protein [candidate division KSB1 bacterium]|nr:SIS domain-containing protein [candidate division KSB1 bacterium]